MNPNPYTQEGQYNLSAKQMKQQQKVDISNIPPPYFAPQGQTPYSLIQNQETIKSEAKLASYNSPVPPMVGGVNMGNGYPPQQQYMNPPPPPIAIVIPGKRNSCRFCHSSDGVIDTHVLGCAVISWSIVLFCFTGCCCWIPFVVDGCFDRQIKCMRCGGVQQVIKSRYGV